MAGIEFENGCFCIPLRLANILIALFGTAESISVITRMTMFLTGAWVNDGWSSEPKCVPWIILAFFTLHLCVGLVHFFGTILEYPIFVKYSEFGWIIHTIYCAFAAFIIYGHSIYLVVAPTCVFALINLYLVLVIRSYYLELDE